MISFKWKLEWFHKINIINIYVPLKLTKLLYETFFDGSLGFLKILMRHLKWITLYLGLLDIIKIFRQFISPIIINYGEKTSQKKVRYFWGRKVISYLISNRASGKLRFGIDKSSRSIPMRQLSRINARRYETVVSI